MKSLQTIAYCDTFTWKEAFPVFGLPSGAKYVNRTIYQKRSAQVWQWTETVRAKKVQNTWVISTGSSPYRLYVTYSTVDGVNTRYLLMKISFLTKIIYQSILSCFFFFFFPII